MSSACERFLAALTSGRSLDALTLEHALSCDACRERLEREERLDALLEELPADAGPADLAQRVARALTARREAALDRLLDLVPQPAVPADLAARVLAGLAPVRPARRPRPLRRLAVPLALVAAAGLLLALVLWRSSPEADDAGPRVVDADPTPAVAEQDEAVLETDDELVAYALEHWELLTGDDLDLLLAGLDPLEQAWIEVAADEAFADLDGQGGTDAPR
jgi:hypothetical protein